MVFQTLKWVGDVNGYLELVDQRRLPAEFVKLQCRDIETLFEAIKTLAVRGAPAIGVSAAYGLALAMQKLNANDSLEKALELLAEAREYLASSRPTAVNLFWAMDRIRRRAEEFVAARPGITSSGLREAVLAEAKAIHQEDVDMCRRIGRNGERFIEKGAGILTHCNAGALATAGQGTALSVMFEAHKARREFTVYADETRPLLQGARLTAWELKQAGIDVVVICDNMAGWLMKQGKINATITGADRIAANGDAANKLSIKSGAEIPIEQRPAEEVTTFGKTQIAPAGVDVCNPAFDVTEARDIAAIITERGVIEHPDTESVSECLASRSA
jgi:methylthioribose-1-phosphate isomerase